MVSFVLVSHHPDLAKGIKALASQMVQGAVKIAVAAGIDDPDDPIGTDAMKIMDAINEVYSQDGVIIFMDLGSALLSTDMALEFLDEDQKQHIYLSDAPIVEGVISAVTQAATGADVASILTEAKSALQQKIMQLGVSEAEVAEGVTEPEIGENALVMKLNILNPMGLHARPAALFVQEVGKFTSSIFVKNTSRNKPRVNAKSINNVMLQEIRYDDDITIWLDGEDAELAQKSLQTLYNFGFGEDEAIPGTEASNEIEEAVSLKKKVDGAWKGTSISGGIVVAPAKKFSSIDFLAEEVEEEYAGSSAQEKEKLEAAVAVVKGSIEQQYEKLKMSAPDEAEIFQAHILILTDASLHDQVLGDIDAGKSAASAWKKSMLATQALYKNMQDELLKSRTKDVHDVGNQVTARLLGKAQQFFAGAETPCVLVTEELHPSDIDQINPEIILGVVMAKGNTTSHASILLRGLDIPAVVGVGGAAMEELVEGTEVILDATKGLFFTRPDQAKKTAFKEKLKLWKVKKALADAQSKNPAVTRDGTTLQVWGNIQFAKDIPPALEFGAEGVGLYRTEYMFLDRHEAPDFTEQYNEYKKTLAALPADYPVSIRTMDVGGDKQVSYLRQGKEENPFLGWRGLRYHLSHPELFRTQLKAICTAAKDTRHPVKVMFPMVTSISEIEEIKTVIARVFEEDMTLKEMVKIGVMVEVPAAAILVGRIIKHLDFISIGTNDLTQYTLAADRGNNNVMDMVNPLHPAVLTLIHQVISEADAAGKEVSMCGEMAGDTTALPILYGMGLRNFSMSASRIPMFKVAARELEFDAAQRVAKEALAANTTEEVEQVLA